MGEEGPSAAGMGAGEPPEAFAISRALRAALPTIRHADMLFDMAVHLLGDEGLVHETPDGKTRRLFRRSAPGSAEVIPWPLLTLSFQPQRIVEGFTFGLPTVEAPHRPETAPNLRGLKPGHVIVHDGPCAQQVTYREDGLWKETVRTGPAGAMGALRQALESGGATPPERIADSVAANDIGRHGPGRLHLPVPLPGGPEGAWSRGIQALRAALHERKLPAEAGCLIADGFDGSARVLGPTREAARTAFDEALERRQPRPPRTGPRQPPPPSEVWEAESWKTDEAPPPERPPDVKWPDPTPANTPAVIVSLAPCPLPKHEWGTWMRALGPHGESVYALQRFQPDGFALVAQDVVDLVDLDALDATLDAVDATFLKAPWDEGEAWKGEREPHPCTAVTYRVLREGPAERDRVVFEQSQQAESFAARVLLDGSKIRGRIFRQRWA